VAGRARGLLRDPRKPVDPGGSTGDAPAVVVQPTQVVHPVRGVKRPRSDANEGKTPALGDGHEITVAGRYLLKIMEAKIQTPPCPEITQEEWIKRTFQDRIIDSLDDPVLRRALGKE
jgi:hypothetical protein